MSESNGEPNPNTWFTQLPGVLSQAFGAPPLPSARGAPPPPAPDAMSLAIQRLSAQMSAQDQVRAAAFAKLRPFDTVGQRMADRIPSGVAMMQQKLAAGGRGVSLRLQDLVPEASESDWVQSQQGPRPQTATEMMQDMFDQIDEDAASGHGPPASGAGAMSRQLLYGGGQ